MSEHRKDKTKTIKQNENAIQTTNMTKIPPSQLVQENAATPRQS